MQRKILIAALLCSFLLSGVFFYKKVGADIPDTATVIRTKDGFSPWKVLIKKGGSVTFKSETGDQYWPASDSHPAHTKYPEFDPKRPLQATEEWTFTFDKAGAWKFHDHLTHEFTGVIAVAGDENEDITPCLERTKKQVLRPECWEVALLKKITTEGLDAAIDLFNDFHKTDITFRDNCHVAGHILGNAAYTVFGEDGQTIARPELFFCNRGFFHGFLKAMAESGGYKNFDDILQYCQKLREEDSLPSSEGISTAGRACIFEFGRAITWKASSETPGEPGKIIAKAIEQCEKTVPEKSDHDTCFHGIFNEISANHIGKNFGLAFGDTIPANICEALVPPYKTNCYMELSAGFIIQYKKMNFEDALKTIHSLPSEEAELAAFRLYSQYAIQYGLYPEIPLEEWASRCEALKNSLWRDTCITGTIRGISGRGILNQEYEEMIRFCRGFPEKKEEYDLCFRRIIERISFAYPADKLTSICKNFPEKQQGYCLVPKASKR